MRPGARGGAMQAWIEDRLPAWATQHALASVARRLWSPDVRRAVPYALVLALALGFTVVLGANLSNAMPSKTRPFGWPGPSSFENAVAMVRFDLVLAATLPALLMGAHSLQGRDARTTRARHLMLTLLVHAMALFLGVFLAAEIGAWGASKAPEGAMWAFIWAHFLLALAFWSLGFLWSAALRRHAMSAALGSWAFLVLLYDSLLKVNVYREAGYFRLASGDFPMWFWLAQALSPLSSYKGVLILWRKGFRDAVERFALDQAALPAWMTPGTFAAAILVLWVLQPVAFALLAWRWRRDQDERRKRLSS